MSAHRDPDVVADYARNAKLRGLRVIIAGAGLSAALPGVVAAHTSLPVIGVPLTSAKSVAGGLDALLSIAQMPPGVPVACVGVDAARNAAVLAARILERMIERYTRPEIGAVWTDEARMTAWRDVEVAAAEALDGPDRGRAAGDPRPPRSPSRPSRSASGSPTTTWPRSSTCSAPRPARRGAGSTTA